jgi:hypothetical protein
MAQKPILSVSINPHLFQKLKSEISPREVSKFVEKAIAKELGEYEENFTTEQKKFQQKLIRGYQAMAKNERLKKDLAIWEEVLENGRDK